MEMPSGDMEMPSGDMEMPPEDMEMTLEDMEMVESVPPQQGESKSPHAPTRTIII